MEFIRISDNVRYFYDVANIGYVQDGEKGMLIDAGIEAASAKKAVQQLEEQNLPLTHLFVTHSHTDHYGGAAYLKENKQVKVIAPYFEASIMEHPILEPTYLFGGAVPLPELRNKFLEAEPVVADYIVKAGTHKIDGFSFEAIHLPGHTPYHLGILINDILFAGDSYLGADQLMKHKIIYLTDAAASLETLRKLKAIPATGAVPGHGAFETDYLNTIDANISHHHQLMEEIRAYIAAHPGLSHEELIAALCSAHQVRANVLSQFVLFRTAITAYITALLQSKKISYQIINYKWVFFAA